MSWWKDADEFVARWKDAGYNLSELADSHKMSRATMNLWKRRHCVEIPDHIDKHYEIRRDARQVRAHPQLIPIEHEQITIEGDAAVSSDWHAPLIHYESFNRFLDDSQAAGLTTGIIAGDLTNQDSLSTHEDKQPGAELEPEMDHLEYSMDCALDVFDVVYVSLGNHDRHAAGKLKVSFDKSLRMLLENLSPEKTARIRVTARDSIIVETERGDWLVCHTRSYSRLPLAYPNKLALRYGCHVAAGHRHHHAQGKAANGKDIVELGGFQDAPRMTYAYRYTNDLPMMANGYGLLVDGYMRCPMLYS